MKANTRKAREKRARKAIHALLGTKEAEYSVNLFVEHHLEELPEEYWVRHLGSARPKAEAVLDLLQLRGTWRYEGIECYDFTLPDNVTNYVICVRFNARGAIESVESES